MSEPVAQMLDDIEARCAKAILGGRHCPVPLHETERLIQSDLPRLLALVRCAESVVDEARDADEDWTDLHTLIREYDAASRGAGAKEGDGG